MKLRPQLAALTLVITAMLVPKAAQAQIVYGTVENLQFRAEISGGSGDSVCLYTAKHHILWMGIWMNNKGYVLAPNRCDTDSYYDELGLSNIAAYKASGQLPANFPENAGFSIRDYFFGFFLLGVLAIFILLAIIGSFMKDDEEEQQAD